jgi:hypothetical protein
MVRLDQLCQLCWPAPLLAQMLMCLLLLSLWQQPEPGQVQLNQQQPLLLQQL